MLWALLPLKDFVNAKQRLAGVLAPHERRRLFQAMVDDVLTVLAKHPDIDNTVIVSDDPSAELLAEHYGVSYWPEFAVQGSGLNSVVTNTAALLAAQGVDSLLVVHGDLPLLCPQEISALVAAHQKLPKPSVSIAPDRHQQGSNCMLCSPPQAISFHYGEGSLHKHCAQAARVGAATQVLALDGIGCDVDVPDDIVELLKTVVQGNKRSLDYLYSSGIAQRLSAMMLESPVEKNAVQHHCDKAQSVIDTTVTDAAVIKKAVINRTTIR